ncbi:hypothetical protein [Bradyrhizobium sp. SEMIA]|uniref:hypothetical protein n=1 Tax=Bradyrhizobium sp. SEMIA TaxID=2597515 RepID=UPI0018A47664|nr:hypothetical protein [Bradyrhizobium sp. SEMIA]QOG19143.1 hypothetical protein FOM02_19110 [Bradyrhizobium sp. SEMIA]
MAEFRCRTCGQAGTWVYDPQRSTCPLCDSIDVQFVIPKDEVPADDPLHNAANHWQVALMGAHPRLFETMTDEPHLREGWRDTMERLCVRIERALREGETFQFVRIVQRFGILRAEWEGQLLEETWARIEEALAPAEARSSCTCELCGAEGEKYHTDRIIKVRCEAHAEGRPLVEARANGRLHPVRVVVPSTPRVVTVRRYDRDADAFVDPPEDIEAAPPSGPDPEDD